MQNLILAWRFDAKVLVNIYKLITLEAMKVNCNEQTSKGNKVEGLIFMRAPMQASLLMYTTPEWLCGHWKTSFLEIH